MHPEENFVAELLSMQLVFAEYAADHKCWLSGEQTFWNEEANTLAQRMTEKELLKYRRELREQFNEFVDPENEDGAVQLMEMAGMSENTIEIYVKSILDRASGKVRTLKSADKRKYTGVYPSGDKWYFRLQSKARALRYESRGYETEYDAMLAREQMIEDRGWTWATRNAS